MADIIHISKEALEDAIKKFDGVKIKIAEYFGCSDWKIRMVAKEHGLYVDGRIAANAKDKIPMAPKSTLMEMYFDQNMTILDMSKVLGASNVTIRKWFDHYDIKLDSHSTTISKKVMPKIIDYNLKNNGYEHFFASEEGRKKVTEAFIAKYGVPYHPIDNESTAELELVSYMNSLSPGFVKKRVFGFEYDGMNADALVAVEFNGIYWHSEKNKPRTLHVKKYRAATKNGYRLFTVFEDEWRDRKDQVKGFIRAALGKNEIVIAARKTTVSIRKYNDSDVIKFMDENHIQGMPRILRCNINIVLEYEGDIVGCMIMSKHHRSNNTDKVTLARLCFKGNTTVIGGSQRMFSHAIEQFCTGTTITSWSDNRWSEGAVYETLGFTHAGNVPKDYSYVKNGKRINKQSMTREKMAAGEDQTEYERAQELGFERIWDCGKKRWTYVV